MLLVKLILDPFNLGEFSEHEVAQLVPFLQEEFIAWPSTARIYREFITLETDITPHCETDVEALQSITEGTLYVVIYPNDPITAIIAVVAAVALSAVMLLVFKPQIPSMTNNVESANNALGQRVNKARPNERIPDIFGTVLSIPELLTVPILTFEDNVEVEISYMCVGRGAYDINNVKDGGTPLSLIAGAGAQFYPPYSSPNSGAPQLTVGSPLTGAEFRDVMRLNEVNGQKLNPPDHNSVSGNRSIRFVSPNYIQNDGSIDFTDFFGAGDDIAISGANFGGSEVYSYQILSARFKSDMSIEFEVFNPSSWAVGASLLISDALFYIDGIAGDYEEPYTIDLSGLYRVSSRTSTKVVVTASRGYNAFLDLGEFGTIDTPYSPISWGALSSLPGGVTGYQDVSFAIGTSVGVNLNGTYSATDVSSTLITLSSPNAVNASWANIGASGDTTAWVSPVLSTNGEAWIGPFVVNMTEIDTVVANIVAPQGMYYVNKDGKDQPRSVNVLFEVTPVNSDGDSIGSTFTYSTSVYGDGKDKAPRGQTLEIPVSPGQYKIRCRRLTPKGTGEGTWVDEVKWRDCYGTRAITDQHFGNVTTVFSRTYATSQATGQKDRKLTCLVTRKVMARNPDNTFGPSLIASTNAADIMCHMALDPYLGGRTINELDVTQIYETMDEVASYFGIPEAAQFGYTFDQNNLSFEEMAQAVAQACFCVAYRQGSVLRLFFERSDNDAVMLFNHRNKIPNSETRTVRFGNLNDHDGIEFDYTPSEGSEAGIKHALYIPEDRSATKVKKLEVVGVKTERHAYLHAHRAMNKIKYQNTTVHFDALGQASQLVNNQKIEIVDNTRSDTNDGHIVSLQGLVAELSQPFYPQNGVEYSMFIQLPNGTLDSIRITNGVDAFHVVLTAPPSVTLTLDDEVASYTAYSIVGASGKRPDTFLLTEKGAYDKKSLSVQAINFDERYYINDHDFG